MRDLKVLQGATRGVGSRVLEGCYKGLEVFRVEGLGVCL